MIDEGVFRLCLAAQLAICLPAEAYFRLRTHVWGERLDRRQEGLLILATLRPLLAARLAAILAFIANPLWMSWSSLPLPTWLRGLGIACGVVSSVLMIWIFSSLGRNLTDTVVARRHAKLVTAGPYRWVRHPLYLSFAVVAVGDTLMTASWFVGLTGAGVLAVLALRTPIEERNLIERFGDEYRAYSESTGKYWPAWRPRKA
jgi:protein-S-isoprenylcysteine O-methyltransferase Ste14